MIQILRYSTEVGKHEAGSQNKCRRMKPGQAENEVFFLFPSVLHIIISTNSRVERAQPLPPLIYRCAGTSNWCKGCENRDSWLIHTEYGE